MPPEQETALRVVAGGKGCYNDLSIKQSGGHIVSNPVKKPKRVLSVGQCFADHSGITRVLRGSFGAEVVGADSQREALDLLRQESFALLLVNRVFDADESSGVDLIRAVKAEEELRDIPVMLVSNYEDAQAQAVREGAVPGFGKAALGQPHMLARVEPYLR
jgi:two-component system chemotaxis response regulator CheY